MKRRWVWVAGAGAILAAACFLLGRLTAPASPPMMVLERTTVIYDGSQYPSIAYEEANRALEERIGKMRRESEHSKVSEALVVPAGLGAYRLLVMGSGVTAEESEELGTLASQVLGRHERISRIMTPDGEFLTHPPDALDDPELQPDD